ncbi:MAG: TonB-dependent receptor [Sphingomonas sp.]|nr:TonB-dependent receptor [Sphingomonas sp.]
MRNLDLLNGGVAKMALALMIAAPAIPAYAQGVPADETDDGGEIVVTATRKSETLSKVPISITALTQNEVVKQGLRNVDDIARLTPGVSIRKSGTSVSNVSIRGIASASGASTIGVYIDDTPIQVRALGVASSIMYPALFDLERVEVLRGPQGTLFGAGSEGGTIRFIQPAPSVTEWSGLARGDVATTTNGAQSYEAAFAIGGPLVTDKIGIRASAYFRHDGGFIDKVVGTPAVQSTTGALGARSLTFSNVSLYKADVNSSDTFAAHIAMTLKPSDSVTITPSINYQSFYTPDAVPNAWASLSNFDTADYVTPRWNPSIDATHLALAPHPGEPQKDKFLMPALKVEVELGFANLISTTSYFKRDTSQTLDYTQIYAVSYAGRQIVNPGDSAVSTVSNSQRNWTQEVRLQSTNDGPLSWVVGGFYSRNVQQAIQLSETNFLPFLNPLFGVRDGGAPFGPGYSAFINFYGVPQINGTGSYYSNFKAIDKQLAGFADATYELTDKLKVTAGIRVARNEISYTAFYDGPANNLNAPRGLACVPGTGTGNVPCTAVAIGQYQPGQGPFAPRYLNSSAGGSDTAVTPKIGVSYQATPDSMVYATASKGFRPSGAQIALPGNCNAELVQLGYVNAQGQASSPQTYGADSVWSYELGAKTRLFGGALALNGSVFHIKWSNIQSSVPVNTCLQALTDNLGSATSEGFDLSAVVKPVTGLSLAAQVGYTNVRFDADTIINGRKLYTGGSALPNSGSPWTVTLSGDFRLPIDDRTYYVRGDYTFKSRERRTGATDPGSFSYDPNAPVTGSYEIVNLRSGVEFGKLDLSLYVNNAFNAAPQLGLSHTRNQPVFTTFVVRPRTVGLTAALAF